MLTFAITGINTLVDAGGIRASRYVTKWTQPGGVIHLPPANRELARSYGALAFPQYCAETGWGNWVMGHAWEIVVRLRPTILAAGFAFAILALPSQMLELYLIDMEAVATELPSSAMRRRGNGRRPLPS